MPQGLHPKAEGSKYPCLKTTRMPPYFWVRNGPSWYLNSHCHTLATPCYPPEPSVDGREPQGISNGRRLNFHSSHRTDRQSLTQHSQTAQHWEKALHFGSRSRKRTWHWARCFSHRLISHYCQSTYSSGEQFGNNFTGKTRSSQRQQERVGGRGGEWHRQEESSRLKRQGPE